MRFEVASGVALCCAFKTSWIMEISLMCTDALFYSSIPFFSHFLLHLLQFAATQLTEKESFRCWQIPLFPDFKEKLPVLVPERKWKLPHENYFLIEKFLCPKRVAWQNWNVLISFISPQNKIMFLCAVLLAWHWVMQLSFLPSSPCV